MPIYKRLQNCRTHISIIGMFFDVCAVKYGSEAKNMV